jgi:phenylacetic acid degradation operon negative regulatory protein
MNDPARAALPPPVQAVLRHFRRQRPVRGGSLLITIFGDAIAARGGAVTLASLIRLAAPFGLTERLVRTAAARLAAEGWLIARRSGRHSEYQLSAQGARRFREATRRIYGAAPRGWDGRWTLLLLPAGAGARSELRDSLRWLGFGQLQPALFAHPGSGGERARDGLRGNGDATGVLLLRSAARDRATDRHLAARGWDLKELARAYRRFLQRFRPLASLLSGPALEPATAFLLRTLLIHEYRKIHLQDPLLPQDLLPKDWVGTRAYELCRSLYGRLWVPAECYLSDTARTLEGALPAAGRAARARFGGVAVSHRQHDRRLRPPAR